MSKTISELADIGANAALAILASGKPPSSYVCVDRRSSHWNEERKSREAFAQAVLDACGKPDAEKLEALEKELEAAKARLEQLEWRPVSVKPTQDDGDDAGYVVILNADTLETMQAIWYDVPGFDEAWTHWRPLALPPQLTKKEKSRQEFEAYIADKFGNGLVPNREHLWDAWQAARKVNNQISNTES